MSWKCPCGFENTVADPACWSCNHPRDFPADHATALNCTNCGEDFDGLNGYRCPWCGTDTLDAATERANDEWEAWAE